EPILRGRRLRLPAHLGRQRVQALSSVGHPMLCRRAVPLHGHLVVLRNPAAMIGRLAPVGALPQLTHAPPPCGTIARLPLHPWQSRSRAGIGSQDSVPPPRSTPHCSAPPDALRSPPSNTSASPPCCSAPLPALVHTSFRDCFAPKYGHGRSLCGTSAQPRRSPGPRRCPLRMPTQSGIALRCRPAALFGE